MYVDEKGPIAAKTHGGTSWSSVQVRIEKAQKINGLLNAFGVFDYTNDKMHVHCYRNKTGKQFVDFLKRVDKRYDKNIQNIFLVLDNLSAHKSKMVKEVLAKYCPRIKLVFLPVRSPELNLIEVRWLWLQRQAINNSTFKDGQEIGQAVSKWKNIYNKIMAKQSQIFYKREYSCVYTTVNLTILSTVLKLSTVLFSPSFSIIMLI